MLQKRIKTSQSKKSKKFPSRERNKPDKNKTKVNVSSKRDIIVLFGQSQEIYSLNFANYIFAECKMPILLSSSPRRAASAACVRQPRSPRPEAAPSACAPAARRRRRPSAD